MLVPLTAQFNETFLKGEVVNFREKSKRGQFRQSFEHKHHSPSCPVPSLVFLSLPQLIPPNNTHVHLCEFTIPVVITKTGILLVIKHMHLLAAEELEVKESI